MVKGCKQIQTLPSIFHAYTCLSDALPVHARQTPVATRDWTAAPLQAACGPLGRGPAFSKPNFELKNLLLGYTVSLNKYRKRVFLVRNIPISLMVNIFC